MKVTNNPNRKEYNMTGPNVTPPPPGGAPKPERKFYQKKRFIIPGAFAALVTIIVASGGGAEDAPATTEAPAVTVEIDEPVVIETTEAPVPETTTTEAPDMGDKTLGFIRELVPGLEGVSDEALLNEAIALCEAAEASPTQEAFGEAFFARWLEEPAGMPEVFFLDYELYSEFAGGALVWQCEPQFDRLFADFT